MNQNQGPAQKLGGWLLAFFIITGLGVLYSGVKVLSLLGDMSDVSYISRYFPGFAAFYYVSLILSAALVAWDVLILVQLYGRKDTFYNMLFLRTVAGLAVYVLILIWGQALVNSITGFGGVSLVSGSDVASNFISVGISVAWLVYFMKSPRVYAYMGSDSYLRKCPISKNAPVPDGANYGQSPFGGFAQPGQPQQPGYQQPGYQQPGQPQQPGYQQPGAAPQAPYGGQPQPGNWQQPQQPGYQAPGQPVQPQQPAPGQQPYTPPAPNAPYGQPAQPTTPPREPYQGPEIK